MKLIVCQRTISSTIAQFIAKRKKEVMLNNRTVTLSIVIVLIPLLIFPQIVGVTDPGGVSTRGLQGQRQEVIKCAALPSRSSIRNEYSHETGMWLLYTEDGPSGVDGGLINLFANYHTCS
jgi:hypothetical protein